MKTYPTVFFLLYLIPLIYGDSPNKLDVEALDKLIKERGPHFVETFNDDNSLTKTWVTSEAKKDGVEGDLAKYDGDWLIDSPIKHPLAGDQGLVFKKKAKHRAISAHLNKDFVFKDKPFVLQYEVLFQEGQECGGGYIKLITGDRKSVNLKNFHDKTPYTIMFGPDKCGSLNFIRFIFRHKNPLNGSFEEKHCKPPANRVDEVFTDGKPHLYGLFLYPDNTYKMSLDHKVINEGSLLTDFTPPVNPPAEIDDPSDRKPNDWDDRENIPDPTATKPDDWNENAPHMIPDPSAVKPENWLENEPLYIRDPLAEKPHDWDVDMDGEWEAALVPNPACEDAAGCGEWITPKVNNPAYKGKWSAPLIPNPSYKGKWSPRKIPNEHYFEDEHPFRMEIVGAVGFELWSMTPNIMFDNILITDSEEFAREFASKTFDVKIQVINSSADSMLSQFLLFTNKHPWLWAIYTVVILVFITVIIYCFFWSKDPYEHKKTDDVQEDDFNDTEPIKNRSPDDEKLNLNSVEEAASSDLQNESTAAAEEQNKNSHDNPNQEISLSDDDEHHTEVGEETERSDVKKKKKQKNNENKKKNIDGQIDSGDVKGGQN